MFLLPWMAYSLITPLVLSFESEKTLGLILSTYGVGAIIGSVFLATQRGNHRRMYGILAAGGNRFGCDSHGHVGKSADDRIGCFTISDCIHI